MVLPWSIGLSCTFFGKVVNFWDGFVEITTLEPMITGLQQALPKSICLLLFICGVTEIKAEILHGIKEVGSALYWMGSPPTLFHLLFSITARRFFF
ncbi:hypothetical protein Hanom_Chr00s000326g01637451 [Helianthus anomalus]